MKTKILFIFSLLLITSVSFSQSKVNIDNLSEYGGKMYKDNDDKPYSGRVFDLYKTTGKKSLEGRYKDGLKHGEWISWYVNGKIKDKENFKNGKENGLVTYWYDNGQKSTEMTFDNGKKVGLWTFWYRNGQKTMEKTYKDGKVDGSWTEWDENGNIYFKDIYEDGVKLEISPEMKDLVVGEGEEVVKNSIVTLNYSSFLKDGTKYDSSLNPGREPFRFTVGMEQVIPGFDIGILGMKVGGKRKITIPPSLGYGDKDLGIIPPNSTLIMEIELLDIENQ